MKRNPFIFYFIILLFSCKKEDSDKADYKCRDIEVIDKASYAEMTELEKLEFKCDSLITEAYNLTVCEECETTDWKWVYYREDFCYQKGYFPYSINMDTITLFKIIDEYNTLKASYYVLKYTSVTDSVTPDNEIIEIIEINDQTKPYCITIPPLPPSHVECQNGKPIVIQGF